MQLLYSHGTVNETFVFSWNRQCNFYIFMEPSMRTNDFEQKVLASDAVKRL